MGREFIQLTGNDDNALEFNRRGGVGAISVTANIVPNFVLNFNLLHYFQMINHKKKQKVWIKFYNQFIIQCLLKAIPAQ